MGMPELWHPAATRETLVARAEMLRGIREFMHARNILEIESPILSVGSVADANIASVSVHLVSQPARPAYYLGTSPEFCMKRLLAAGSGAIYQITRVFRDDHLSRLHQPEFSMLEWYRPGFDHHRLMDEICELLTVLGLPDTQRVSYEEAFVKYLDINPHSASIRALQMQAEKLGLYVISDERSMLLEFLFSHAVSPNLGREKPILVYHYPACQAALARISEGQVAVAERFELFIDGMELANGFHELTDANEQRQRFQAENRYRQQHGLQEIVIDEMFLAALQAGLPPCAGVAVGLDRLLMALTGIEHINEVMSFPITGAQEE